MSYLTRENGYKPISEVNGTTGEFKAPEGGFKVITICGSMKFYQLMLDEAARLTENGYIVLMPFATKGAHVDGKMLDAMHRQKIRMAEMLIFVTGPDDYMGPSTRAELHYAGVIGTPVLIK